MNRIDYLQEQKREVARDGAYSQLTQWCAEQLVEQMDEQKG